MAVVAANTGHLVLTSIHTSRASGCISRMEELGVSEEHLFENLLCVSNQRMMVDRKTHEKVVLYEIMDRRELEYYRVKRHNSPEFIDVERQIERGIRNGIFAPSAV